MLLAKDIMTADVITVSKDTPAREIAEILLKNKVSGVPVVDKDYHILGVVSEKDLLFKKKEPSSITWICEYAEVVGAEKLGEELRRIHATRAEEIMSKKVRCLPENASIVEIASVMLREDVKRVFVVRGKKLIGVVSKVDILKHMKQERQNKN